MELSNARRRNTDLLTAATPVLQNLRDDFEEMVNLGVLDGDLIRYVGVWESHDRLRLAEKVGAAACQRLGKGLSCATGRR